ESRHRHAMGLNMHAFARKFLLDFGRFALVAGDHGVHVVQNSPRLQEQPEDASPFKPANWVVETFSQLLRNVEDAAVNGQDRGQAATAGNRERDSAEASERMRMNQRNLRLAPESAEQMEGHQVAADGDHLAALLWRNSPDWHAS